METATDTRRLQLSEDQIRQYHDEGYLVVEHVLPDADIEAFLKAEQAGRPEGWRQNLRNHTRDEQWRRLATHPNVVSIVKQILGGKPMIVQTMYLEKPPAGNGTPGKGIALHQDTHYLPNEPNTLMACWMALNDTDGENGGLCVVPGSNKQGLLSTHFNPNTEDHDAWQMEYLMRDRDGREWKETIYSFEIVGLDESSIKRLAVPKGGAVFFTGLTVHGSYANRSKDRPRLAFASHYVKEGTWLKRTDVQELVPADDDANGQGS